MGIGWILFDTGDSWGWLARAMGLLKKVKAKKIREKLPSRMREALSQACSHLILLNFVMKLEISFRFSLTSFLLRHLVLVFFNLKDLIADMIQTLLYWNEDRSTRTHEN